MISVLLLDSSPENPSSLRKLLSSSGSTFKLNCADTYGAILEGFRSKAYDVCLIDVEMDPGLKLIAQAQSLGWAAPIIMIAANDAGDVIRAMRSGVADCLIRGQLSVAELEHSLCCVVDQARSTALLNRRERRYLALLDNADQIIYTHDLKGVLLSINRTGEHLMGYPLADILGMNVSKLVARDDQALMKEMIERTLDAHTQMHGEVKLLTKDGRNLLVDINTHPINYDGRTLEIQGIATWHSVLTKYGSRESRSLTEQDQSHVALEDNAVFSVVTHEATNSFLLPENLRHSGRSLFTL